MPLCPTGCIEPVVDRVFDWRNVANAQRYMEKDHNMGRVVLEVTKSVFSSIG